MAESLTFEDLIPNRLIQTHKPTGPVSFDDLLPQERKEKYGVIEKWTTTDRLVDRIKRTSNVAQSAVLGDVPFVKNWLPKSVQETTPQTSGEKMAVPLIRVGRDLAVYGGAGKLIKPLTNMPMKEC